MNIFFSNWTSVVFDGRNDVVFENRNKNYGAYLIRKEYGKELAKTLLICVSAVTVAIAIPVIYNLLSNSVDTYNNKNEIVVNLVPPPVNKNIIPPPVTPPLPPVLKTIKFTPPVITDDNITQKEIPPMQDDLSKTQIGEITVKGDSSGLIMAHTNNNTVIEDNTTYDILSVQEQPSFQGGDAGLFKFLQKNVKYPQWESEIGIQGTVFVSFVVDKDGSVTDVEIYQGLKNGPGCNQEALRVVKLMPKWSPGKNNGHPVRVSHILPVRFKKR